MQSKSGKPVILRPKAEESDARCFGLRPQHDIERHPEERSDEGSRCQILRFAQDDKPSFATLRIAIYLLICVLMMPLPVFAQGFARDTNRFSYGFQRLLLAPFRIPIHAYQGTVQGPLVVGTLAGVLSGTVRTVTDMVGGTFDMAAAAAPYAKYAVFAL